MRALIIFDEHVLLDQLNKLLKSYPIGNITLFPLTSSWKCIHEVERICQDLPLRPENVHTLESGHLIDEEVKGLRAKVAQWSTELGSVVIDGKMLKEWFLLDSECFSTWWFSVVVEKNTQKTNAFFQVAQLQAIDETLSHERCDLCLIAHSEPVMSNALQGICKRHVTKMPIAQAELATKGELLRQKDAVAGVQCLSRHSLIRTNVNFCLLRAVAGFARVIWRSIVVHLLLAKRPNRNEACGNVTLFVTYYPSVDTDDSLRGVFRNRMAGPLQDELVKMGKKVVWICIYVPYDFISYMDAARLTRRFIEEGESIFLIEEFSSLKGILLSLFNWIRKGLVYLKLRNQLRDDVLSKGLGLSESGPIIRAMMDESFLGWTGLAGLVFLEQFKNVFARSQSATQCIYYMEMHEWEKALNAARRLLAPRTRTIGFQHTSIPENLFSYLCSPSDIDPELGGMALPLPDIIACNGDIPLIHMAGSGFPNLRKVEALRQLYLGHYLEDEIGECEKQDIVLLIGTIIPRETRGIISFLHEAFPHPEGFKIWVKGHPSLAVGPILSRLGVEVGESGWEIHGEPVIELLKVARVVIVGFSSVAIEAIAHGCSVITPVLSNCMFMSPLAGFENSYVKVVNVEQLRTQIYRSLRVQNGQNPLEIHNFVKSYWYLDESLKLWKGLLDESPRV